MYYRYAQKWVDLFSEQPTMVAIETMHYIKGMHNLIGAHFDLHNAKKLKQAIDKFEEFSQQELVQNNENYKIQTFIYLYTSKINLHFSEGTFTEGLKMIPTLVKQLDEFELYLDKNRVLMFYYKIASLYFASGDSSTALDYLNKNN